MSRARVSADHNLPTHSDLSPSDSIVEEEIDAYDVEFHYAQFFAAFAIHMLHVFGGPACIPLIWGVFGRKLAENMGFFWLLPYLFEFLSHLILLLVTLLYVFYPTRTDDFRMIVIATLTTVFLRLGIISMKYGTLTRKWWQKLQQTRLTLEDLSNTLLLRTWLPIPADIATSQLKAAFGRLPLHTTDLHFIFTASLKPTVRSRLWDLHSKATDSFFCPIDVNPDTYESAFFIARLLLEDVINQRDKAWKWFARIAGVGYTLCPHLLRLYLLGPSTYQFDAAEWTIVPLSLFFNCFFAAALLNFIVVGIVDFQRKRWLMSQCSGLISDCDRMLLVEHLPKIDLSDVRSIYGWYYTRRAFLDFGRRFSNRIHVYASTILPILLIAVVFIVLQMLGVISRAYNWELVSPLFLSIAFDVVIINMILEATALNLSFEIHSDLLQEAASRLETTQKLALEALQWTVRKLEVDQELRPVTILGFTIDKDLVNKLLALGLSGAFALLKLLFT